MLVSNNFSFSDSNSQIFTVTREELYRQVWDSPMSRLPVQSINRREWLLS